MALRNRRRRTRYANVGGLTASSYSPSLTQASPEGPGKSGGGDDGDGWWYTGMTNMNMEIDGVGGGHDRRK